MEFQSDSRYSEVANRELDVSGRTTVYKAIRVIEEHERLTRHEVKSGERPDHIAFLHFRDPEQAWRIADANRVLDPDDLVYPAGDDLIIPRES